MQYVFASILSIILFTVAGTFVPDVLHAQSPVEIATTTLRVGICGNGMVDPGQDCDVPGQTGEYSTTIDGRQCDVDCTWGPYCGDGVLQTQYGEECDDGTNTEDGFCTADCQIILAGAGGGGSSGGGSSSSGGGETELGDTQVRITGQGYPNTTINILLDGENVGTVRTSGDGTFEFLTGTAPGTASLGVWADDNENVRSITYSTTFDVTQAAITTVDNVMLPPTITLSTQNIDPGDTVIAEGQAIPNETVELHVGSDGPVFETEAGANGRWEIEVETDALASAEYTVRARSVTGSGGLTTESSFSNSLQLFVGVDGTPSSSADLNRDERVDLVDFSILVFWWGTDAGDSDPSADINQDSSVNLADFSILLFNWTG